VRSRRRLRVLEVPSEDVLAASVVVERILDRLVTNHEKLTLVN